MTNRERDTLELGRWGQLSQTVWTEEGGGPRKKTGEWLLEGRGMDAGLGKKAHCILNPSCAE